MLAAAATEVADDVAPSTVAFLAGLFPLALATDSRDLSLARTDG